MRRLDEASFHARIEKLHGKKYTILSSYQNSRTPVKFLCNLCGHIWTSKAVTKGYGCPECGKAKASSVKKWHITQEDFLAGIPTTLLEKINIFSRYTTQHGKIEVQCKACRRRWESTPYKLYLGYGCDPCKRKAKGIRARTSHIVFCERIAKIHGNSIQIIDSTYTTGKGNVKAKCLVCNHVWTRQAFRMYRRGCPKCKGSKGEVKIASILDDAQIEYKRQFSFKDLRTLNTSRNGLLRFDFAVFKDGSLSHLIEYDGIQHFKAFDWFGGEERFEKTRKNDSLKNDYCKKHTIRLLRIPYTKYKGITINMLQ